MPPDTPGLVSNKIIALGLVLIHWQCSLVHAEIEDGKPSPDRLTLGTVHIGAVVEASVRILIKGDDATELEIKTTPPAFLRVIETKTGTQTFGGLGTYIYCDIFISLDTSKEGAFDDSLKVQIGDRNIDVPVSTRILPKDPESTRVLIAETPIHRFSTNDATQFEPWLNLVTVGNLDVSALEVIDDNAPVLRDIDLSKFQVILLGGSGLFRAKEQDFKRLKKFVEEGGRVIITANYFFRGTVEKANSWIEPLGMTMSDSELRVDQTQSTVEVGATGISEHDLTARIEQLKFHRPSPISITDSEKGTLLVQSKLFPGQGLAAVVKVGKGEVVALGVSLWWHWIASQNEADSDNAQFLLNLLGTPIPNDEPTK